MDAYKKLSSTRVGRDKVLRTIQYALRIVNSSDVKSSETTVQLEKTLASCRKLFRFGTSLDTLLSVEPRNLTKALSQISLALYLLLDHLVWLNSQNVVDFDRKTLAVRSNRLWTLSALLSLLWSLQESQRVWAKHKDVTSKFERTRRFLADNPGLVLQGIVSASDAVMALAGADIIHVPGKVSGVAGVTSSLLGILVLLRPSLKC